MAAMDASPPASTALGEDAWRARSFTSSDGLRIFYRDYPGPAGRPPLICLHGLTRNSRDFEDFAAAHAGDFRVVAMDFRGRGQSERDPRPERYNPLTYAQDVVALLDELGIDKAIFVGTSLGGLVTMVVAAADARRIAGAILNDVGPVLEDAGLERIRTYVGRPRRFRDWAEAGDYVAGINNHLPAVNRAVDWQRMARRVCREDGGQVVLDYDMRIADAFNQPGGAPEFDMWPLYRMLARVPLLIVRGEATDLLSPQTAQRMVEEASDARLVTVAGVGHAPDLTEPEAAAAIDEFLKRF